MPSETHSIVVLEVFLSAIVGCCAILQSHDKMTTFLLIGKLIKILIVEKTRLCWRLFWLLVREEAVDI